MFHVNLTIVLSNTSAYIVHLLAALPQSCAVMKKGWEIVKMILVLRSMSTILSYLDVP